MPCTPLTDTELGAERMTRLVPGRPSGALAGCRLTTGEQYVVAMIGTPDLEAAARRAADEAREAECEVDGPSEGENSAQWSARHCEELDWGTVCERPAKIVLARFDQSDQPTMATLVEETCPNPYNEESVGEPGVTVDRLAVEDIDDDGRLEIVTQVSWSGKNERGTGPSSNATYAVVSEALAVELSLPARTTVGSFGTELRITHADIDGDGHRDASVRARSSVACEVDEQAAPIEGAREQLAQQIESGELHAAEESTLVFHYSPVDDRFGDEAASTSPSVFRPCH